MTLEEDFNKFDDSVMMKRPIHMFSYDIKWLKGLKEWGNKEFMDIGFIIEFIIEDTNADDWEIINE